MGKGFGLFKIQEKKYLASASWDKQIIIWDLANLEKVKVIKESDQKINKVLLVTLENELSLIIGSTDGDSMILVNLH